MAKKMRSFGSLVILGLYVSAAGAAQEVAPSLGIFEHHGDVGDVLHPGSAEYDAAAKSYTLSGSGENMWFAKDDFHFVWKKVSSADLTLSTEISILGPGGDAHRKAVLMIRQSLDTDSVYVDAARHGEGLTSLQYRERKGAVTREIESNVSGPAKLRIEKQGDLFYMWVAAQREELQFAGGSARVEIRAPFYVGIGVCAHDKDAVEKAVFTNVELSETVTHPKAHYSTLETALLSGDARSGYVSGEHLTAPGWSEDGQALTFQIGGRRGQTAFTPLRTAAPVGVPLSPLNEKKYIYFAESGSGRQIWRKLADGTQSEQLTSGEFNNTSPSVSPDGKYVLFLSYPKEAAEVLENAELTLRLMSTADRAVKTLATFIGGKGSLGTQPWSPDGKRIVFVSYQSMN